MNGNCIFLMSISNMVGLVWLILSSVSTMPLSEDMIWWAMASLMVPSVASSFSVRVTSPMVTNEASSAFTRLSSSMPSRSAVSK